MKPLHVILLSVLAAIVASVIVVKSFTPATEVKTVATSESAYDHVLRTQTIRCAYSVYAPSLIKDPNTGALSGIFYDLFEEMGKRLQMKIEWAEEVPYGNITQGFVTKRYDVFCGPIWPNPIRAKNSLFTIPVSYSPISLWVRADDTRFDGQPEKLNDPQYKISSMDGDIQEAMANIFFPKAERVSIPQMGETALLWQNVIAGKADGVIMELMFGHLYIQEHPNTLKEAQPGKTLRLNPNVIMLPDKEHDLKKLLDVTLTDMHYDGTVERIIKKYIGENNYYYFVDMNYRKN